MPPPDPNDEAPTVTGPRLPGGLSRIGRYTVKRVIASGGMGTVLEAVQDEPRRTVALKIMRGGVGTPEALRRFQFEAQLLARLRHPAIAQIFEAGTHDDGSGPVPYFAMEYIPSAKTITEYAASRKLDLRARLALFATVCDAVHHGHQKGIIHRDLKPGNILVDSGGAPHIIDFGIARASDSDSAQPQFQTEVGQLVGSLIYMSPEQFEADPNDLDLRSDVYSLGVVLHELIAGALPYDVQDTPVHETARIVREVPPRRLCSLDKRVPVEVETIVCKALEKERERRYQSAFGLAEDLRRFLTGQPISAAPPSAAYQLRTFARRNKPLLAGVAAAFVVLLAGVAVSTSLYVRAQRERVQAQREAARAQAAIDFLTSSLESIAPENFAHEPTMADLVNAMSERIDGAFPEDPLVEAELRRTIAYAYLSQFDWLAMQKHLERATELRRGAGEAATEKLLQLYKDLQLIYEVRGEMALKVGASEELVRLNEALHGADAPETMQARYELADALSAAARLGDAWDVAAQTCEARRTRLGNGDVGTLESEAQLAWILMARGDMAAAEQRNAELLKVCRSNLGDSHELTRTVRSQLAAARIAQGKLDEARAVYGDRPLPDDLDIQKRYQGIPDMRSNNELLVFWETWCPHSQRTVPRLEEVHLRHKNLDVLGLTRTRHPSNDDEVMKFIADKQLTFPVAKVSSTPVRYFDVQGTPWIILAHKGRVIWENHMETPEALGILEDMLRGLDGTSVR